jgi:hypothetical protein
VSLIYAATVYHQLGGKNAMTKWVITIIFIVLAVVFLLQSFPVPEDTIWLTNLLTRDYRLTAFVSAFGLIAVLLWVEYFASLFLGGHDGVAPSRVFSSGGGGYSISKWQIWVWTLVISGAYSAVFIAARILVWKDPLLRNIAVMPSLNTDLLLLLGFSSVNAVGAKAIVEHQKRRGERPQEDEEEKKQNDKMRYASLVAGAGGSVDIYKLQLLAWTLIAIGIFIINACILIYDMDTSIQSVLPDLTEEVADEDADTVAAEESEEDEGAAEAVEDTETDGSQQAADEEFDEDAAAERLHTLLLLPTIGTELLFLMGISQSTYLGGKWYARPDSKNLIRLQALTLPAPAKPTEIMLTNTNPVTGGAGQFLTGWQLKLFDKTTSAARATAILTGPMEHQGIVRIDPGQSHKINWEVEGDDIKFEPDSTTGVIGTWTVIESTLVNLDREDQLQLLDPSGGLVSYVELKDILPES